MQDVTHPVCPSWGRPFLAVDLILSCIEKGKLQHKGEFFFSSVDFLCPNCKLQFFTWKGSLIAVKCIYPANIWLKDAVPRRGYTEGHAWERLFWALVLSESLDMILTSINKSPNQKKTRGRMGLAVKSPRWLEK